MHCHTWHDYEWSWVSLTWISCNLQLARSLKQRCWFWKFTVGFLPNYQKRHSEFCSLYIITRSIRVKAGSHCDISISINISIRIIVSVNRCDINISISIRKWKIFHFLMFISLCLCCFVAWVNRSCISISMSISMSAVFPSVETHGSRVQSRFKNAKNGN